MAFEGLSGRGPTVLLGLVRGWTLWGCWWEGGAAVARNVAHLLAAVAAGTRGPGRRWWGWRRGQRGCSRRGRGGRRRGGSDLSRRGARRWRTQASTRAPDTSSPTDSGRASPGPCPGWSHLDRPPPASDLHPRPANYQKMSIRTPLSIPYYIRGLENLWKKLLAGSRVGSSQPSHLTLKNIFPSFSLATKLLPN